MNFAITTDKNQLKEIVALCIRYNFYIENIWFIINNALYPPTIKAIKAMGNTDNTIRILERESRAMLLNPKFAIRYFVLTDNNKVIGFIIISNQVVVNGACFLEYILIDDAYKGMGLSSTMFNEFFGWCEENNIRQIKIQFEPTDKLKYLYTKQGFKKLNLEVGDEIKGIHENWYKFI